MKTNYINQFQMDIILGGSGETPEEKAKRIGVPLIPAKPKEPLPEENPVVAVCGECGMEWKKVMWYSCKNSNCPMQTKTFL